MDVEIVVFDWGDTLMRDSPQYAGPMVDWPHVEVVPGAIEALETVSARYTCCVASNAGQSDAGQMALALQRVGLRRYFRYFWTSRELGANKPDLAFYEGVLERLTTPAEACVMVGNSLESDILPAGQVGMLTVWLAPASARPSARADHTIHHLGDLPAALDALSG